MSQGARFKRSSFFACILLEGNEPFFSANFCTFWGVIKKYLSHKNAEQFLNMFIREFNRFAILCTLRLHLNCLRFVCASFIVFV